jgi:predicted ATPase
MQHARAIATSINHPESIAFAGLFGSFLHQFFGSPDEALRHAEDVLAISAERDVATTLAWAMVLHGWALGATGRLTEGIEEIRQSLAIQRAAGAEIARPQFAWMLGDLCLRAGKYAEANAAAEDGLSTAARSKDHYWDSELLRLKGEIVVESASSSVEAEALFRAALADARERDAKSLELRAAISLARLMRNDGRVAEARAVVRPVYEWFTEGLATADLVAARELLSA